jgi:hypothetical protein
VSEIEAQLRHAEPRLTARVVHEMYGNPFWQARFGERGRDRSGKDGGYHLTYVIEALAAGDPRSFVEYARWLREVLVSRGMCSFHLIDNFERLARAIDDEPWTERARASAILRAGAAALRHADGDAGAVDAARIDHALDEVRSFLSDALAAGTPRNLIDYVVFMDGLAPMGDCVDSLAGAVAAIPRAAAYLAEARGALVARRPA